MKKYLLLILILLIPTSSWGANWFAGAGDTDFNAVSGTTISSVWNDNADGTSGNYLDWSTQPANGDIFIANGATIAIDDSIGSGSVTVTLTTEGSAVGGTDGGGFTMDIGTNAGKTLYVNIGKSTPEGTTDCLTITDAADASDGTLTIIGNAYGGASASADGIADARVDAQSVLTITGNVTGGTGTGHGIHKTASNGQIVISGTATGSPSGSTTCGIRADSVAVITVANCVASVGPGCWLANDGSSSMTITGNIVNTATNPGVFGKYIWSPAAATNYIKIIGDGTPAAYYLTSNVAGGAHPAVADVRSGTEYGWDGAAVYTGELAVTGGGASAW